MVTRSAIYHIAVQRTARLKVILLLIALCCNTQLSIAQYDSVKQTDIIRFADGILHNISSPLRWDKKDWTTTTVVLLGSVATSSIDQPVNRFLSGKRDPVLDIINDIGYSYGKPYSAFIFTGGFYLSGLVINNEWAKETGLMLGTALMTSGLLEATLKPLVGRARPENGSGNYDFNPFVKEAKFHSFPSGHAAIAFTISFVLAKRIKSVPLKIFFYSLAATTAFCRLYSNAHWLSDVGLGGAIAWFSSSESVRYLSTNRFRKTNKTQISLRPNLGGMTLRISFN